MITSRPAIVAGLRLLRLVGSGGEGEVWEARDDRGRRRALKLVRPDALADDAEERIASLLHIDHPALVRTTRGGRLSGGGLDGWGFLEMDFVDGPSLHEAPPDPAVLERLAPLAEALDLLHDGVWSDGVPLIHRDIKPANLVASRNGVVLVDPSTLRGLDATTLTRVGTPVFAAPEIITGRITPLADVYSFAATIVALLTGLRGSALAELIEDPFDLDLPEGVAQALAPRPADRPRSCLEVLAAGMTADPTVLLPRRDVTLVLDEPAADADAEAEADARFQAPRRPVWPWVAFLLLLIATPLLIRAGTDVDRRMGVVVVASAVAAHVAACVVAREPLALTLLAPPVAWADLLSRRIAARRLRRDWARAVVCGGLLAVAAGGVAALWPTAAASLPVPVPLDPWIVFSAGMLMVPWGVAAATARGAAGVLLRLVAVPAWAVGAALILAGGLLLAPFAATGGVAMRTLGSVVEVLRPSPARPQFGRV